MNIYRIAALSAVTLAASFASSGAFAQSKCGLGNGKKADGEPIAVGAVVGKTGPDDFSSSAQAAAAYFKCVNENGGINGRPVEILFEDDGTDPKRGAEVVEKLVSQAGCDLVFGPLFSHVVIGTDYPYDMGYYKPVDFIERTKSLTRKQKDAILGGNAANFLRPELRIVLDRLQ